MGDFGKKTYQKTVQMPLDVFFALWTAYNVPGEYTDREERLIRNWIDDKWDALERRSEYTHMIERRRQEAKP